MIERIPLEQIEDNPFQVRLDYSGIAELAGSIAAMALIKADTSGLLQVPPARIVMLSVDGQDHVVIDPARYGGSKAYLSDWPHAVVQLAAGHRRLRAFRHLAENGHTDYATFPVDIQVLDDQAMDDIAAAENANRQDLSVIEEALSLQRAMEVFGLSQAEVGARRGGLTQAAVSNKIRLLALPDWCRQLIHQGDITERHGRAVLPWLQLPGFTFHAGMLKNRISGAWLTVDELERQVRDVINAKAEDLNKAPWSPRDGWAPDGDAEGVLGACGDCKYNVSLLRGRRCVNKDCYQAKLQAHRRLVTAPDEARSYHGKFDNWQTFEPEPFSNCSACHTHHRDMAGEPVWYRPADKVYPSICGNCWTRAGLPEPGGQPERTLGSLAIDRDEGAAPSTPQPAPVPTPRPVPDMRPVEPPPPPPPAAILLTARILPAVDGEPRPTMMAIGPEGRGPAPDCVWTGVLRVPGELGPTVEMLADRYFEQGDVPTLQSPATEEILMEVDNV